MIITSFDCITIIADLIVILFVVIKFKSKVSSKTFLIADRNVGFFSSSMTISASKIGAGLILTYSALVFRYGFSALWLFVGYVFGYVIFYFFAARLNIESKKYGYYTLSDYFLNKYGKSSAYLISVLVFLSMFGWILTNLIGGGKLFQLISGFSFTHSIIVIVVVISIYLLAGGFSSVVKTDIFQYISVLILFFLLLLVTTKGGLISNEVISFERIKISEIIAFFLTGFLFPLGSAELWQRVYATKTVKALKASLITASILYFVLGVVLSLICLKIRNLPIDINDELALISGMGHILSEGFMGLLVIVIMAAVMSSADTFIFTASSTFCQDYLQKIYKLSSDKTMKAMKIFIIVFAILGALFSILIRSIVDVTFIFASLTLAIGIIVLFTWIKKKVSSLSINLTVVANIVVIIIAIVIIGINTRLILLGIVATTFFMFIGELISKFYNRQNHKA